MATKQRVQVRDLADAPRLQATIQSGGNYNVAVQQAGDNKMLQLARSLEMVNPMLRNATSVVAMDNAQRRRDALTDLEREKELEELAKNKALSVDQRQVIEELKKSEKRRKGFRNTLLKRAINNDLLPSMEAEADNLLDVDKFKTQEEFKEAVNAFIDGKWEDFSAEVGNNVADTDAAKILWNHVVDPYRLKMDTSYDKKLDEAIAYGQEEEVGLQLDELLQVKVDVDGNIAPIDAIGLREIAENRETLMREQGIEKKERNSILIKSFTTQVDSLIVSGRLKAAQTMLNEMYQLKINGNPTFRSTEAKAVINRLVAKLSNAETDVSTVSQASLRRQFSGEWGTAFRGLRLGSKEIGGIINEDTMDTVERLFTRLNVPQERMEELKQAITESDTPAETFDRMLVGLAQEGGEEAMELYYGTSEGRQRAYEGIATRPILASTLALEKKQELEDEFRDYHNNVDDTATKEKWMSETGKNFKVWNSLTELDNELNKGGYVFKTDAYKGIKDSVKLEIEALSEVQKGQTLAGYYMPEQQAALKLLGERYIVDTTLYVERQVRDYAKSIANKYEGDDAVQQRDNDVKDFSNNLVAEETERFKRIRDSRGKELRVEGDEVDEDLLGEMREAESVRDKPGLSGLFTGDIVYPSLVAVDELRQPAAGDVEKDRKAMFEAGDSAHLGRSLWNYGFTNFDVEAAGMLEKAGLDADDVRLFGSSSELIEYVGNKDILGRWQEVIQKDMKRTPLTAEEEKIREEYIPYGIATLDDLDDFKSAQFNLITETNTPL